ncbi:MAG: hypothetical protein MW690_001637 [Methanophagales archaeon]|nr:hypothetical protein [Methanophagales archaeon]
MLFITLFLILRMKYEQERGCGEHKGVEAEGCAPRGLRETPEGASERRGGAL